MRNKIIIISLLTTALLCISLFTCAVENIENTSTWNGINYKEPTVKNGVLIISSADEMAWILKHQNLKNVDKIRLTCNVNMNNKTIKSFPSSLKEFDGNNCTIQNINVSDSGLFGDSSGITVYNLILENVKIIFSKSAGILVGKLTGNSVFQNIKIKGSSLVATTGTCAGGFVGEVVRQNEKDRSELLNVKFNNCLIESTVIGSKQFDGKFVGYFSGYDNCETISFNDCVAKATVKLKNNKSTYISKNQSCFATTMPNVFDGFIGDSKYYRGVVSFNKILFIHKWDGKTTVEPLLANKKYDGNVEEGSHKYVIYTPFDLAGVRAKTATPNAIYLKTSVDMNGQAADNIYNVPKNFTNSVKISKDDNIFKPFTSIALLDGGYNTIYNLAISEIEKTSGAFILSASGTTTHKNITFENCNTVVTHKTVKKNATAQGAILIASAGGSSYTAENITIKNCKVYALQKVGSLVGYLNSNKSIVNNCIVQNGYVENYKCNISETFDSGNKTFKGRTIRVTASFYPQGEVGGLIGFVQNSSKITNCQVNNTKINAYGQADKMATITGSRLGIAALKAAGYYQVPGRHVGTLIGDIRATKNVTISDCSVNNSTCLQTWDKHNVSVSYIGRAYYVEFLDAKKGTVKANGNTLTLADCNRYTTR